jgi:hypothetical protein
VYRVYLTCVKTCNDITTVEEGSKDRGKKGTMGGSTEGRKVAGMVGIMKGRREGWKEEKEQGVREL